MTAVLTEVPSQAGTVSAPTRLAIVVTHPIQHFVPFYRAIASRKEVAVRVFFCSRVGLEAYYDRDMRTEISWSMDLTSGYDHEFLPEAGDIKTIGPDTVDNPSIGSALSAFAPDAVLVYGYNLKTARRALLWCRRSATPAMMTGDSELLRDRAWWRSALKRVVLPVLLRQFTCFLTTGDNNEAYLRHYGVPDDRFFRVPFTIDEASYLAARRERAQRRHRFRRAHGIDELAFVALAVGKLAARKRPGDLLAALTTAATLDGGRRLHAVFAGSGELRDSLESEARACGLPATFLGFVNVDQLPNAYCAADVLVHPSEHDPHPLVCSEAACVGLPLVLSDRVGATGPTDIARAGGNAIVFPCGEVPTLAAILTRLARDSDSMAQMELASLRIFSELDMSRSVDGLLQALHYCRATAAPAAAARQVKGP